jgi:hypothetical protein
MACSPALRRHLRRKVEALEGHSTRCHCLAARLLDTPLSDGAGSEQARRCRDCRRTLDGSWRVAQTGPATPPRARELRPGAEAGGGDHLECPAAVGIDASVGAHACVPVDATTCNGSRASWCDAGFRVTRMAGRQDCGVSLFALPRLVMARAMQGPFQRHLSAMPLEGCIQQHLVWRGHAQQ